MSKSTTQNLSYVDIVNYFDKHPNEEEKTPNYIISGNSIPSYFVEILMIPLVEALNNTGFASTKASCHGHWRKNEILFVPFVAFAAPLEFAEAFDRELQPSTQCKGFAFYWEISARFNHERELIYYLTAPDTQFKFEIIKLWWWQKKTWLSNFRDQEFSDLKKLVLLIDIVAQGIKLKIDREKV